MLHFYAKICGWHTGARLSATHVDARGESGRHDRGTPPDRRTCDTSGLAGVGRAAVWLLSVRSDHGSGGVAQEQAESYRRRHRRGDDWAHLPLRDIPANS